MPEAAPRFAPTQEVRFALVMYGGSSLCIYMNGVAQEFLSLVRATAPSRPLSEAPTHVAPLDGETGTEAVYRKLGQLLRYGDDPRPQTPGPEDDVTTRFVVDILSGSSAGGINGVFLAKALANEQPIDELKNLWVEEGDFDLLLNDKHQAAGTPGLQPRSSTSSLLSGNRMYRKLLDAFTKMDDCRPAVESRFVEELDLAVTTTDLRGLPLPIKLFDSVVMERRYRNVFELKYRTPAASGRKQNDFRDQNPGLAFAARSTSAFPFVFEPSVLNDIDGVLSGVPGGLYDASRVGAAAPTSWRDIFLPDYARVDDDYRSRSFGDGGDIDNKPFSYAIDNLAVRRSTVPVNRKLVYVEPDPGSSATGGPQFTSSEQLNTVDSVFRAISLPRAETIREDLGRVRDHNRAAARVLDVIKTVEDGLRMDLPRSGSAGATGPASKGATAAEDGDDVAVPAAPPHTKEAAEAWVDEPSEVGRSRGLSYVVYHRLKVRQTAEALGLLIAREANLDDESDHSLAVRILVRAWIGMRYGDPFDPESMKPTANQFLLDYDVEHRMRRINFVERRADELLCDNARSKVLLELAVGTEVPPEDLPAFHEDLKRAKAGLNAVYVDLRNLRRTLAASIKSHVEELGITTAQLDAILVPQAVEQVLHTVVVEGDPLATIDFIANPPGEDRNPRRVGPLELTVLGPRDALAPGPSPLEIRPGDPEVTRPARSAGGRAAPEGLPGMDGGSVLVLRLDKPVARVTMCVSSLAWPPRFTASGPPGAGTPTIAVTRDDRGSVTVDVVGAGISQVVMWSADPVGQSARPSDRARRLLSDPELIDRLSKVEDALHLPSVEALTKAATDVDRVLGGGESPAAQDTAGQALRFFFDQFDEYDMAILPLVLTQGAQANQVDVLRISPYDATSLVPADKAASKLAGNKLGHYAAFAHKPWRKTDIMWGRLDAAERLITALLPVNHPLRDDLLVDVQQRILVEELAGPGITKDLSDAVLAGDSTKLSPDARQRVRDAVEKAMSPEKLLERVKTDFAPADGPSSEYVLKVASRATRVVGEILKNLSAPKPSVPGGAVPAPPPGSGAGLWLGRILARLGQFAWGLVEISVPHTVRWRVARYWLQFLTFTEVFLIVVGFALNNRGAVRFGWLTLSITVAVGLAKALLTERLTRPRRSTVERSLPRRAWGALRSLAGIVAIVVALSLVALVVVGGYETADRAHDFVCDKSHSDRWRRAFPFDCADAAPAMQGSSVPR